jgi:hypothetical protein
MTVQGHVILLGRNYQTFPSSGMPTQQKRHDSKPRLPPYTIFRVRAGAVSQSPASSSRQAYPILQAVFVMGRAICSSLAIFLLLITAFLVFYPVPLSRNVIVHTVVYAVYFLSLTMTYFVRNVAGPDVVLPLNIVLQAVTVLTLLAWIVLLSPAGEQVVISVRPRWAPEEEQRLVRNLDSINAALLRAARK